MKPNESNENLEASGTMPDGMPASMSPAMAIKMLEGSVLGLKETTEAISGKQAPLIEAGMKTSEMLEAQIETLKETEYALEELVSKSQGIVKSVNNAARHLKAKMWTISIGTACLLSVLFLWLMMIHYERALTRETARIQAAVTHKELRALRKENVVLRSLIVDKIYPKSRRRMKRTIRKTFETLERK